MDRETGLLYLYPPKNAESVSFVADEYPFFVLEGSSRITLKGLRFKKGIGNGIKISNAREVTVVDCMISLVSNDALVIDNSVECEAVNNIIYDVGASGIVIRCGDRKTLTPGDTEGDQQHHNTVFPNPNYLYAGDRPAGGGKYRFT